MISKIFIFKLLLAFMVISVYFSGCVKDDGIPIGSTPFPTDAVVFDDDFGSGVTFQAFMGSKLDAVQIDQTNSYTGPQGLAITVPDSNDATGSYAGGAFTSGVPRDLREYNALTFWAKATKEISLDVTGIGNDNTGTSKYTCEISSVPITTSWHKIIMPIPLSEKLNEESGLFYFAEGPEDGIGCTIYIDEVIFDNISTITNSRPTISSQTITAEQGDTITVGNGNVTFSVDEEDVNVSAMSGYFTFESSDSSIVDINSDGTITADGAGTATLTAKLGDVVATGTIIVNVTGPLPEPSSSAPTPTVNSADVISIYSDAYSSINIDTWSPDWDIADIEDFVIGSDSCKKYTYLTYAGIDFSSSTVDVSGMTHFHIDMWTPYETTVPTSFKVKIVDFGANGVYGGDDTEHEISFTESTIPAIASGTWVGLDIPLTAFTQLYTKEHVGQIIISGDLPTVYIDNIYFYDAGEQTAPLTSAPTPTVNSDSVISLFSDAYTNIIVDTWSAVWDQANVADYSIGSDQIKQYTDLVFAAIEFRTNTVNATTMTHFHIDVWTPDAITSRAVKIKLIDFGANGIYGGGDDVEHEVYFGDLDIVTGLWAGLDIAISDLTGLTTKSNIGQIILSGDVTTLFVDNIYFYDSGIPTAPIVSAPVPTHNEADVVSMFSDVYTDVPVDTWSAPWDSAGVSTYMIGTDSVKKYVDLLFAGIEFESPTIDASSMAYFHMDVWTPDPTSAPSVFKIKLVDYGPDGEWDGDSGGNDDVEHELTLDETIMDSNTWVSLDIPLTDFVNLTTTGHLAQLIISGTPNTVYIDNVYFHK